MTGQVERACACQVETEEITSSPVEQVGLLVCREPLSKEQYRLLVCLVLGLAPDCLETCRRHPIATGTLVSPDDSPNASVMSNRRQDLERVAEPGQASHRSGVRWLSPSAGAFESHSQRHHGTSL